MLRLGVQGMQNPIAATAAIYGCGGRGGALRARLIEPISQHNSIKAQDPHERLTESTDLHMRGRRTAS